MPFIYDSQCPEGHWQSWGTEDEHHSGDVRITIDESVRINANTNRERTCRLCKKTKSASQFLTAEKNRNVCKECAKKFKASKLYN